MAAHVVAQFRQQREKGNLAEIGSPTAMPFKCFDRGVRSLKGTRHWLCDLEGLVLELVHLGRERPLLRHLRL